MRVLLVKMSSLGDVIHALPAVTDAAAEGHEFDWVVEEAFASVPARHPGVRQVIPIAWRRWRKRLVAERGSLARFVQGLRSETYDLVLDAQGLLKSAAVAALARAPVRSGLSFTSAREPAAAFFYDSRINVPLDLHAVDRLRLLFARSLGYPDPAMAASFGLPGDGAEAGGRRCLLLHGTTWPSKHWPERMWRGLTERLCADGWQVALPWADADERARAERIAAGLENARVLASMSLAEIGDLIRGMDLVVGVDSGLTHLAGAWGTPTVALYGSTNPTLTGCRGARVTNLASTLECSPCRARNCRYRGAPQLWRDELVHPACYARLTPDRVRDEAMKLVELTPH